MNAMTFAAAVLAMSFMQEVIAEPLGTGFTYQGELTQQGQPADGVFDFKIDLFDVDTDGSAIAASVLIEDTQVSEGVFTMVLDFGSESFTIGEQLWLELAVRDGASSEPHTILSPRQPLSPTPIAVVSLGYEHNLPGENTRAGQNSLDDELSGIENTALGFNALTENTTGFRHTAVGANAMSGGSGGENSVAVGADALAAGGGFFNTAVGSSALAGTLAGQNTAVGHLALTSNFSGFLNTAVGSNALENNFDGLNNTGVGAFSLRDNISGSFNTAIGDLSFLENEDGSGNVVLGSNAMSASVHGSWNIVIGYDSGNALNNGSHNIVIANNGVSGESNTTRIGDSDQTRTFISGIRGTTTDMADAVGVVTDSNGQLGTVSSSIRYKEDVEEIRPGSDGVLSLRPVTFRYKRGFADGAKPMQYGLIAEEVAEINPLLVTFDEEGQPESVKYHLLSILLINEVKQQARDIERQQVQIQRLQQLVESLIPTINGALDAGELRPCLRGTCLF